LWGWANGGGSPGVSRRGAAWRAARGQKEDEAAEEREADDESERDKKKLRKIEETYEDNMVCGICTHVPSPPPHPARLYNNRDFYIYIYIHVYDGM
jgi:hypothetical protein